MPKHLTSLPTGTTLPTVTGLPQGYPFLLEAGSGSTLTRTLYQLQGTAFVKVVPEPATPTTATAARELQIRVPGTLAVDGASSRYGVLLTAAGKVNGYQAVVSQAPVDGFVNFTIQYRSVDAADDSTWTKVMDGTVFDGSRHSSTTSGTAVPIPAQSLVSVVLTSVGSTTAGSDLLVVVPVQPA